MRLRGWRTLILAVGSVACLTTESLSQIRGSGTARDIDGALITGRILDASGVAGLPDVEVRVLGGTTTVRTDSAGDFRFATTARGSLILVYRKLGYDQVGIPLDVRPGDSLHVAATMKRTSQDLDTVRVLGRSEGIAPPRYAGFERRRLLNHGTFFTPEQLERTASVSIGDVLRGIPSIKVTSDQLGILAIESTRGMRLDPRANPVPCRIRVMVDGFIMPLGMPMPVASPKELHGIEVYAGPATIPRELIANGEDVFCGLVAIWTK